MKRLFLLLSCVLPILLVAQTNSVFEVIVNSPDYKELESLLEPSANKMKVLESEFRKASKEQKEDKIYGHVMEGKARAIFAEHQQVMKDFIRERSGSPVTLIIFSSLMQGNLDLRELQPLYDSITDEVKNSDAGKQVTMQFLSFKKTAIGAEAPEFTQNNPEGKLIKLSDFRGKYVLLDFWASWCNPCRKENPHIVETYGLTKGENFEILGISLDNGKNAWLAAIEKDNLTWPQVSDLKGWKNEVAILYGVRSIPQNFLLDPNGVIIAKDLRGEKLTAKLKELLK
jgi:Peroxiredoxin